MSRRNHNPKTFGIRARSDLISRIQTFGRTIVRTLPTPLPLPLPATTFRKLANNPYITWQEAKHYQKILHVSGSSTFNIALRISDTQCELVSVPMEAGREVPYLQTSHGYWIELLPDWPLCQAWMEFKQLYQETTERNAKIEKYVKEVADACNTWGQVSVACPPLRSLFPNASAEVVANARRMSPIPKNFDTSNDHVQVDLHNLIARAMLAQQAEMVESTIVWRGKVTYHMKKAPAQIIWGPEPGQVAETDITAGAQAYHITEEVTQ